LFLIVSHLRVYFLSHLMVKVHGVVI